MTLISYTYDMLLQETRISVSLATVEFTPVGDNGTRLVFTEQGCVPRSAGVLVSDVERDNREVLGALDRPPEADDVPVTLVFLPQ